MLILCIGVNTETLETAYKAGSPGRCRDSMKAMPQLRFSIRYDLRKSLPDRWSGTASIQLASGNAYSSHGDFTNGWTEDGSKGLVDATAQKLEYISVNDDLGKDGDKPTCKATDADPTNGTGDYAQSIMSMRMRSAAGAGWSSRNRMM